jgi:hypothetical protein
MNQNALHWIAGRDTGVSSKTIWAVMVGTAPDMADVPHDPDDFGRCFRLLELVPEWRPRLPEVAARYPKWGPMVEVWDELEALYRPIVADGGWNRDASRRMYDRMRELEDAGLLADGWERVGTSGWWKNR